MMSTRPTKALEVLNLENTHAERTQSDQQGCGYAQLFRERKIIRTTAAHGGSAPQYMSSGEPFGEVGIGRPRFGNLVADRFCPDAIVTEVIPDLIIYALQFGEVLDVDIDGMMARLLSGSTAAGS